MRDDRFVLSRDEVRRIDAAAVSELGMTGMLLMENAARGVSDVVLRHFTKSEQIVIVCGAGNNGGDGLALSRLLAASGLTSRVLLIRAGKELTDDAAANLSILRASQITVDDIQNIDGLISLLDVLTKQDLVVDCLLGTGVRGSVRPPFDRVIDAINNSESSVLSVDVPSGLDSDTGTAEGAIIRADRTVTFVGWKKGFLQPGADVFTGDVTVAHIGLPVNWVRAWLSLQRQKQD